MCGPFGLLSHAPDPWAIANAAGGYGARCQVAQPPNEAALSATLNDLSRERMTVELLRHTEAGKAVAAVRKAQGVPDSVKLLSS